MLSNSAIIERRSQLLGENVTTFYTNPVHLVKGEGVWLYDADGRRYLDCYNNVAHVGHCHPHVVEAIIRQAQTLNTHTRYLHTLILDYAEKLLATYGANLNRLLMTCTGSEANDVALRMAQAVTGRRGVIATDFTYHGNSEAVSLLSKRLPAFEGMNDHMRYVPAPDSFRPLGGENGEAFKLAWLAHLQQAIDDLKASPHGFSSLVICPVFANEGFPDLPDGFLTEAAALVRKAGGIVIADEVQPGFGRMGSHMWGHQYAGFEPDIATMGKPMGNGHPVGGVVTSAEIMNLFRQKFRYFNTFGGNPVSSAAALAVLEVIEAEKLIDNAKASGAYALAGLLRLSEKHSVLGNVHGAGLFFGAEILSDRGAKVPDADLATRVVDGMRERGVLLGKLGIHANMTKIRPPMPFNKEHADVMLSALDDVLSGL